MLEQRLATALADFRRQEQIHSKGALAVVVHVTRLAQENGLPLNAATLVTEGSGQVLALGKSSVQRVLEEHGISQVLAEEGGRTSRGSLGLMQRYVSFLNQVHGTQALDLGLVERWWIDRVREYFAAKPLKLRFESSKSLQFVLADLLAQAKKRQSEGTGTMVIGAVLQHLVGAKLELALPGVQIAHHGFSVADNSSQRQGDFAIDDSVLHVTTSPSEALMRKCQDNLRQGLRPVVITRAQGVPVARGLATNLGIEDQLELLEAEQFLSANLHEMALFRPAARHATLTSLIETYNRIVEKHETDPSLRIVIG